MTASLIIDIVIALICVIIIVKDAVRGFIKSFMIFARTILAFLIAYVFNAPLARIISDKFFVGLARGWVHNAFSATQIAEDQYALYKVFDGIPDWFTNFTVSAGVDDWMIQEYFVNEKPASTEVLNQMSDGLGEALAYIISVVIAFLIIFIITEIIVGILGILLNKIGKIPMLKIINVLLGACIGVIISAVLAWLISKGISWVIGFGSNYYPDIFKQEIIDNSAIMRFFLENDLWVFAKDKFAGSFN